MVKARTGQIVLRAPYVTKCSDVSLLSQIINTQYFAPLLTVNQYASDKVLEEIPSVETFASLSNWLMRPVPTVTAAVRRFNERYFEDNYVIGERWRRCDMRGTSCHENLPTAVMSSDWL